MTPEGAYLLRRHAEAQEFPSRAALLLRRQLTIAELCRHHADAHPASSSALLTGSLRAVEV
jgi:hypothetical protein